MNMLTFLVDAYVIFSLLSIYFLREIQVLNPLVIWWQYVIFLQYLQVLLLIQIQTKYNAGLILELCPANRPVSQMQAPLVACCELVLDYDTLPKLLYVFGHKT